MSSNLITQYKELEGKIIKRALNIAEILDDYQDDMYDTVNEIEFDLNLWQFRQGHLKSIQSYNGGVMIIMDTSIPYSEFDDQETLFIPSQFLNDDELDKQDVIDYYVSVQKEKDDNTRKRDIEQAKRQLNYRKECGIWEEINETE